MTDLYTSKGQIWRIDHADGTHVTVALTRHTGASWVGVVVESTHPSYPVGGYDISVHVEHDLAAKGRRVDLVAIYALVEDGKKAYEHQLYEEAMTVCMALANTGWEFQG